MYKIIVLQPEISILLNVNYILGKNYHKQIAKQNFHHRQTILSNYYA